MKHNGCTAGVQAHIMVAMAWREHEQDCRVKMQRSRQCYTASSIRFISAKGRHLPAHMFLPPMLIVMESPIFASPPTGLFATLPWLRTPSTTLSRFVSMTTPPTIISPSAACNVSKLNIRSSSQTFWNSLSRASTKTWIKSSKASGDSVVVLIKMKYNVA